MIRLPPSSISLAESDLDFHLRQAEIYHGLMRQGFTKQDITRYLSDYRRATFDEDEAALDGLGLTRASTVDLASRRPWTSGPAQHAVKRTPAESSEDATSGTTQRRSLLSLSEHNDDDGDDDDDDRAGGREGREGRWVPATTCHVDDDADEDEAATLATLASHPRPHGHAPRKSSLLRFAEAASPDHPRSIAPNRSPELSPDLPALDASPATSVRRHRRRSEPRPAVPSDPDERGRDAESPDYWIRRLSHLALDSHEEEHGASDLSDEAVFTLPPPLQAASPAESSREAAWGHSVLDDAGRSGSGRADGRSMLESPIQLRSSPPISSSPLDRESSPIFPDVPLSATPLRRTRAPPRSEPRDRRHRFLDGNAFSVYNDALPASAQPQTPADLVRSPWVTEREAAYTAPPGRVHTGAATTPQMEGSPWHASIEEPSPTARAINLRERRTRELRRSVRAEEARLRRMILRDETLFTQRALATTQAPIGGDDAAINPAAAAWPDVPDEVWRDDLDADRVGEENFEGAAELNGRRVMRVVSGNARFDGWEAGVDR